MLYHVQLKRLVCEYMTVPVGANSPEEAETMARKASDSLAWERIASRIDARVRLAKESEQRERND